jgi:pantoate--beta-alanine ligase
MQVISSCGVMQKTSLEMREQKKKIAMVPTMGFLHEGHLRLVDEAKRHAACVVMSIFVNPTQFGPGEDFAKYPRDLERDRTMAEQRGVDILFVPSVEEMYPAGDQSFIVVTELSRGLCGPFRPGHFRGVATVVAKLFLIVQPHAAVFGEKDYQQLKIIERMVRDLHLPVKIVPLATVREADGLAMSSRNSYLRPEQRSEALNLYAALKEAQNKVQKGVKEGGEILKAVREKISSGPNTVLEYAEIVDSETLAPLKNLNSPCRLLLAARVHGVRLIDNAPLLP